MPRSLLLRAIIALAVIWGAVWLIASIAGQKTATPEKVLATIETNPLNGLKDADERRNAIAKVAEEVNRLDYNQRQELFEMGGRDQRSPFFRGMSEEEVLYFVDLTLEQHFRVAMKAFNEMEPEERQKMIDRALSDMDNDRSEGGLASREKIGDEEAAVLEKVVQSGMQSYYQEASAEVKMDLAPLLEKIQGRMQGMRR
jgi:hypothetical protein